MNRQSTAPRAFSAGFSLVELMIAMTLGLFIVLAVVNVFLAQRQAYRTNEDLAQMQNSARAAFELLAREVREGGVNLCGAQSVGNVLASTSPWYDWAEGGLRGYDNDVAMPVGTVATGTATGERVDGTDAIIIRSGSLSNGAVIAAHAASADPITVNTNSHGFAPGDVLIACDYRRAVVFQATSASSAGPDIGHAANVGTPGNCDGALALDCGSGGHAFGDNGFVAPFSVTAWYIGNNGRGGRSLFRMEPGGAPQEIAAGVWDMQLQYLRRPGESPVPGPDGSFYVDGPDVDASDWTSGTTVVAVRVILDLRSNEAVGTDAQPLERQLIFVVNRRGFKEIQL